MWCNINSSPSPLANVLHGWRITATAPSQDLLGTKFPSQACLSREGREGGFASNANLRKPYRGHLRHTPLWPHDHIHLAAQPRQHPHDAFDRDIAEMAAEQAGYVGLADACGFGGGGLGQAASGNHILHARDELCLEQMGVGIGIAQISEHIAGADFDCFCGVGAHAVPLGFWCSW